MNNNDFLTKVYNFFCKHGIIQPEETWIDCDIFEVGFKDYIELKKIELFYDEKEFWLNVYFAFCKCINGAYAKSVYSTGGKFDPIKFIKLAKRTIG